LVFTLAISYCQMDPPMRECPALIGSNLSLVISVLGTSHTVCRPTPNASFPLGRLGDYSGSKRSMQKLRSMTTTGYLPHREVDGRSAHQPMLIGQISEERLCLPILERVAGGLPLPANQRTEHPKEETACVHSSRPKTMPLPEPKRSLPF
jgi:hypothetical protein